MSDREQKPAVAQIDRRHLRTAEVFEGPPAERPSATVSATSRLGGLGRPWRLLATGTPLLRVTLHSRVLHRQYLGKTVQWWRATGQTPADHERPRDRENDFARACGALLISLGRHQLRGLATVHELFTPAGAAAA